MNASEKVHVRDAKKILKSLDADMSNDLDVFGTHDQKLLCEYLDELKDAIRHLDMCK